MPKAPAAAQPRTPEHFEGAFQAWLAPRRGLPTSELRRELKRLDDDTLDRWAFGVAGSEIIELQPKDLTIAYFKDLEEAQHEADHYPGGPKQWAARVLLSKPILVRVSQPGEFVITDGHHRYLAALLSGRKLLARVVITGKSVEHLLERAKLYQKTPSQLDQEIAVALSRNKA